MASLTKKDTLRVSRLAKLDLTPEEIDKFTEQLSKVVDLMDELNEVDVKNTEPTAQTTGLLDVLRNDEIDETRVLTQEEALSGSDSTKNGFFEVNAILNKND